MRRSESSFFALSVFVIAATLAASQVANSASPDETPRRNEAKRLFRAGAAAYTTGQYLAAAQALEQSYELIALPATAFSLAQAYRLQFFIDQDPRHLARSVALYRIYIDAVASGARRSDAVASLAELEPIKLRLDVEKKTGTALIPTQLEAYEPPTQLMVVSASLGAKVVLDGQAPTDAPLIAVVAPGRHVAVVRAPGYATSQREIQAVEGRLVVVEVDLKEEPAQVWINGPPGAQLWLDGRMLATLPQRSALMVTAGKHRLMVIQKGRVPWARFVTVERGGVLKVDVQLAVTVQRQVSYAVMAIGSAGLVTGGVLGLLAIQEDQEAARIKSKQASFVLTAAERDRYNNLIPERNSHANSAWLIFGIGVAVTGTGSLLYHFDPGQAANQPNTSWVALLPSQGGLMGAIGGRF
jgi:hypothetical protein